MVSLLCKRSWVHSPGLGMRTEVRVGGGRRAELEAGLLAGNVER